MSIKYYLSIFNKIALIIHQNIYLLVFNDIFFIRQIIVPRIAKIAETAITTTNYKYYLICLTNNNFNQKLNTYHKHIFNNLFCFNFDKLNKLAGKVPQLTFSVFLTSCSSVIYGYYLYKHELKSHNKANFINIIGKSALYFARQLADNILGLMCSSFVLSLLVPHITFLNPFILVPVIMLISFECQTFISLEFTCIFDNQYIDNIINKYFNQESSLSSYNQEINLNKQTNNLSPLPKNNKQDNDNEISWRERFCNGITEIINQYLRAS